MPSVRHAQIGVDDGLIGLDSLGRAIGDFAAVVEHDHPVGDIHYHAHIVFDERDGGAILAVHLQDEARHVLLLLKVHPRHRLIQEQQLRFHGKGAAKLDALLQPVGQLADGDLANVGNLQKVDDVLGAPTVAYLLERGRAVAEELPHKAAPHLQGASCHDVVERRHTPEESDVLERPGDALTGGEIGSHVVAPLALERDSAFLRVIEAVDNVEHRGLAGAVGTDDGADLALADVEGNIAQGTHAAKGKRHVLDSEQDITWGHGSGAGRYGSWFDVGLHSAASRSGSAVGIG